MFTINTFIEDLKKNNLKVTPQRLVIYDYLCNNHIHPSAETIYNNIKQTNPTISLATVYKTLKSLKGANLIQEINVCEDSFRYDVKTEPHFHIICKNCKRIKDYMPENDFMNLMQTDVSEKSNFKIDCSQVNFYGLCENCSNDE